MELAAVTAPASPEGALQRAVAGIARALGAGDEHEALRWGAELVADVQRMAHGDRAVAVADDPGTTGDARWDALVAGLVEHCCVRHKVPVPAWTVTPGRFLERWWFLTPYRSLMPTALVEAPAALANRGVFVTEASLRSV